jgi:hypothetical protein
MSLYRVVLRELLHYRWNAIAGLCAVMLAVAGIAGTRLLLRAYETRTVNALDAKQAQLRASLASLEDDIRTAMGELGFNLVILPEKQDMADWYAQDEASAAMPEDAVERLTHADSITIRYPVAQLRRRIEWPETKWNVILIGRAVPPEPPAAANGADNGELAPRHYESIPKGTVTLGYELHRVLGFKEGDTIQLRGRSLRVHKCLPREGNKDDVAVWMDLKEAQEVLGQPGQINEIVALGCSMAPEDFTDVRAAVARVLPGTQVVERTPHVLAAAKAALDVKKNEEAMSEKERLVQEMILHDAWRLASFVNVLVVVSCAIWIGWLAWSNAVERRVELGVWRACGLRAGQLVMIFLGRWMILGLLGAGGGLLVVVLLALAERFSPLGDPLLWGVTLGVPLVLSATASAIAVVMATREDPASVLRTSP